MKYTLIYIPALILLLVSCSNQQAQNIKDIKPVPDSIVKNVQTAPVIESEEGNIIRLNGKIVPDENAQAKVFAMVSGKIQGVKVELGDYVNKGQTLAILKSVEVAGISNDLSAAESDVVLAKKTLETTKELYEGKLATEQDFINAQMAYNKAIAALDKSKQVASITGGTHSSYVITAPISGYVIQKNITNNSEVRADNNTELFEIANLSTVWIMANVYESDMNNIHLGDAVIVNTLASPGKDYRGKVDKIYNVLDPATRTMQVRVSMNNSNNELKPEMFATIKVEGKTKGKMLSIPSSAVIMDNSKNYVVIKGGNKLEVKEIDLFKRIDDKSFITGLSAGEQVVTNSQVFLYQALINK